MNIEFTWDMEIEDDEYKNRGRVVLWALGRTKAIQKFVESLSYKIGHKCDWDFMGGHAHIDVLPEHIEDAVTALSDSNWLNSFIVPYSEESYKNETYFTPYRIFL